MSKAMTYEDARQVAGPSAVIAKNGSRWVKVVEPRSDRWGYGFRYILRSRVAQTTYYAHNLDVCG